MAFWAASWARLAEDPATALATGDTVLAQGTEVVTDNPMADTASNPSMPSRENRENLAWELGVCLLLVTIRSSTLYLGQVLMRMFPSTGGAGLLGGLLIADAVDDFGDNDYDAGYDAGFDDGGDFDM